MSHDQKLKMKQIGELVANYFVWINKLAFLIEGEYTLLLRSEWMYTKFKIKALNIKFKIKLGHLIW